MEYKSCDYVMTAGTVEIYPYRKKKEVRVKPLNPDNVHSTTTVFNYVHDKYLELFNEGTDVKEIVKEVLVCTVQLTNSKDGFLAIVKGTPEEPTFEYYCVYMEVGGVAFESKERECKVDLIHSSLLSRAVIEGHHIISNQVETDPRSISKDSNKFPKNHIQLSTFMSIPLYYNGQIIGLLGVANAEKYNVRNIEEITPIKRFCSNFIWLNSQRKLSSVRGIEMKKEVSVLKDSFVATMSHEIRTPLNGIVGMSRLLSESTNLTTKQQDYVRILADCSVQLMELVNDILDYSKMSSGGVVLNKQPFNLKNCIKSARDIVLQRANDKGIELRLKIPEDLPENMNGDSRRLKQVIFNLLTNAVKFTDTGHVELSVSVENVGVEELLYARQKKVIFHVTDTGIGIKKHDQKKIFELFTKVNKEENFYTNTTPGAGMGLAISKFIVEEMDGEISVKSDGKHGSTFTFYVLLDDETDITELLKVHKSELAGKTAVIIDDTEDNRIFLMDALYSWNIDVMTFSSGREALNYMEKHPEFDIAVIDLCMPNMSGVELTQTMRERGYTQPVIGLSSIGSDFNGKEWFDYFCVKPISKSSLFNLIVRAFMSPKDPVKYEESTSLEEHDVEEEELSILIAEDDYYNQILMTEMLSALGYKNIKMVGNGKKCVEAAKQEKYSVCLMDVKMPVMDGLEATRLIKRIKNPPVVIGVSASVLDSDKNKCYTAGMDGYIPKPIQKDQLDSVLKSLAYRK